MQLDCPSNSKERHIPHRLRLGMITRMDPHTKQPTRILMQDKMATPRSTPVLPNSSSDPTRTKRWWTDSSSSRQRAQIVEDKKMMPFFKSLSLNASNPYIKPEFNKLAIANIKVNILSKRVRGRGEGFDGAPQNPLLISRISIKRKQRSRLIFVFGCDDPSPKVTLLNTKSPKPLVEESAILNLQVNNS
ncbi:hypothetical protein J1N35_017868 [Gossypium stocksii]|uniref:Uncharacterized protein n=1 Tax=Gossypium stocksii TaxID=47602 RepID=A0A9D4A6M4_9ROSI|nr:hypothetical protein J1N35_017868 [Gossypium stocksii]